MAKSQIGTAAPTQHKAVKPKKKFLRKLTEKLLPCPFCGGEPHLGRVTDYIGKRKTPEVPHYFISCDKGRDHAIQVGGNTRIMAIQNWNQRKK